uniref:Uncharacterized protein n=1 Tax=Oryza glumipatula TaxID=40148 RepID=A0A0D9Z6Q9_9ORYZ
MARTTPAVTEARENPGEVCGRWSTPGQGGRGGGGALGRRGSWWERGDEAHMRLPVEVDGLFQAPALLLYGYKVIAAGVRLHLHCCCAARRSQGRSRKEMRLVRGARARQRGPSASPNGSQWPPPSLALLPHGGDVRLRLHCCCGGEIGGRQGRGAERGGGVAPMR